MDVAELTKENECLKAANTKLCAKITFLEEQLALAFYKRFGRSSESIKGQSDLPFASELGSEAPQAEQLQKETITYERAKRGRKPLSPDLPREHLYHDIPESERICACGHELEKIGEDVSERLNVIPPKLWVEAHHYAKYACPQCDGINDDDAPAVKTAEGSPALIPGSIVTPGLVAFVWTNKFCNHQPFYRQETGFERIGTFVSRQDMSNWTIRLAEDLEPLISLIEEHIRAGPVIQMDETPVKVLKLDHTGKDGQGYMWLATGGIPDHRAVRYRFAPGRGSVHASSFLGDYSGFVQSDGYKAYDAVSRVSAWTHVGCWAHVRRKFYEAEKIAHSALTTDALGRIRKLYDLEREARERALEPEEFLEYRKQRIVPYLRDFKTWIETTMSRVLPSGKTGEAFSYAMGQWEKLERFLDHAYLTPDNNRAENAIRPFVIGRKNWLFSGNDTGAEASCRVFSLIETAKLNGKEPYAFLLSILSLLPAVRKSGVWDSLLPWNLG
ncbi:MAG: IS66 family transposase [Spirochaetes bacterium]|nr:IS66 family transposase [Spirochaetota bacterium]